MACGTNIYEGRTLTFVEGTLLKPHPKKEMTWADQFRFEPLDTERDSEGNLLFHGRVASPIWVLSEDGMSRLNMVPSKIRIQLTRALLEGVHEGMPDDKYLQGLEKEVAGFCGSAPEERIKAIKTANAEAIKCREEIARLEREYAEEVGRRKEVYAQRVREIRAEFDRAQDEKDRCKIREDYTGILREEERACEKDKVKEKEKDKKKRTEERKLRHKIGIVRSSIFEIAKAAQPRGEVHGGIYCNGEELRFLFSYDNFRGADGAGIAQPYKYPVFSAFCGTLATKRLREYLSKDKTLDSWVKCYERAYVGSMFAVHPSDFEILKTDLRRTNFGRNVRFIESAVARVNYR